MKLIPGSTITQTTIASRAPAGFEGMLSSDLGNRVKAMAVAEGLKEIDTLTLTNWSAARTYTAIINGLTVPIVTPAPDANVTGAAARLRDAINADPRVRGQVVATAAAGVITLTSTLGGLAFTLVSSADAAAAAVQSASQPPLIPLGCALIFNGQAEVASESYYERLANERVTLPLVGNMTARVVTLTPTAANLLLFGFVVTLDTGETYNVEFTSDASGTVQEIVEGQLAALPPALAGAITATEDNVRLTLTAAVPGRQFSVTTYGPGVQAVAIAAAGSDFQRLFAGFSAINDAITYDLTPEGRAAYPPGHSIGVLVEGEVMCVNSEAALASAPIWIETAPGVNLGRPFLAPSATRLPLAHYRASEQRRAATPSDNLLWVNVRR